MNTNDSINPNHQQNNQPERLINSDPKEQTDTVDSVQDQSSPDLDSAKIPPPVEEDARSSASQTDNANPIKPLLDPPQDKNEIAPEGNGLPNKTYIPNNKQEQQSQSASSQKFVVTKVKLTDELNIFDWFKTTDIINQIAEKAKNSVDSVITTLDPGMKEYLYSGGNINIIVISNSNNLVSPIRDSFQSVFGRATVVAARYNPPEAAEEYPIRLAKGFNEAVVVAKERIKRLRLDTSNVPQNQVIVVIQPTLVTVTQSEVAGDQASTGLKVGENLLPRWFFTYCMIIEDPVLGVTMNSYSQFIPIDPEIVTMAQEGNFPDGFSHNHLGFSKSIIELIFSRLDLESNNSEDEGQEGEWLKLWSGMDETKVIYDLSMSLAHLYRRKWNDCIGAPCSSL